MKLARRPTYRYGSGYRTHIGRSGRRMIVGPGHARTGTQIARFGTTPGGYLGGQLGRRLLDGYRAPYLESAATVRDASRDSRESSGAAMANIPAPAPARWTGLAPSTPITKQIRRIVTGPWQGTGRSQDRHRSVRPVQSTDKATRVPSGRIASVVHIGSCWNAFTWLRNGLLQANLVTACRPDSVGLSENRNL
jgi:hypothetical protein